MARRARPDPPFHCAETSGFRSILRAETADQRVLAIASHQYALIALTQARALGMTEWAVRRRVQAGWWREVLPRVYLVGGAPSGPQQAVMASVLWAGGGSVASHETAAWIWGFEAGLPERIHVSVPARRAPRSASVVVHRTGALADVDRDEVAGIPVTSAARTVLDNAGELDDESLLAAVEYGLDKGLYRTSFLSWRLEELGGKGRPGSGRLRRLLAERGTGVAALEYRLEVKTWRLLISGGLPRPRRQLPVRVDGRVYRLDFAWPEHRTGIECDGYDVHGGRRAFDRDRDRLAELGSLGWRILPVTWDALTRRPETVLRWVSRSLERDP
jgi:very-short-patch-repair endonuclease